MGRPPVAPFYTAEDVARIAGIYKPLQFHETREVAAGISIRIVNAGHMLGSGSIEMTVREAGSRKVIVFSGDVGQKNWPILRDPETLSTADLVFLESTYGDREHRTLNETVAQFSQILSTAIAAGEKVLIPSFAIGRAQQIVWHIAELVREGRLPPFPVYLDSPMALKANDIYRKHHSDLDQEAQRLTSAKHFNLDLPLLEHVQTAQQSAALNNTRGAAVIIAGSGMCNAGRILHHLKHNLYRPHVAVLLVGYQANGTLGRQLVDGAKIVRIHGQSVAVRAKVHTLGGFSGHAGQSGLLEWLHPLVAGRPRVALTHGEESVRQVFAAKIRSQFGLEVLCPMFNHVISL